MHSNGYFLSTTVFYSSFLSLIYVCMCDNHLNVLKLKPNQNRSCGHSYAKFGQLYMICHSVSGDFAGSTRDMSSDEQKTSKIAVLMQYNQF